MRILSGAQPSGRLHLGNYFGAIRQWIDLQAKGEGFFIANLHALTTVRDPQVLRDATFGTACDYLAMVSIRALRPFRSARHSGSLGT